MLDFVIGHMMFGYNQFEYHQYQWIDIFFILAFWPVRVDASLYFFFFIRPEIRFFFAFKIFLQKKNRSIETFIQINV